jgi:uncharacterized membrane protein
MTTATRETASKNADDLPYRIVEEMGLGLTFRSCTCGQLPCARLRPLRDALEAVRRDERERAAKIADERAKELGRMAQASLLDNITATRMKGQSAVCRELAVAIRNDSERD